MANLSSEQIAELMEAYNSNKNASYDKNLEKLGAIDLSKPSSINIYPKDFEAKEAITSAIQEYNDKQRAEGKEENVKMILFSNPNNPTGQIIEKEDLCRIADTFKCPVVIDEAYGEFMEGTMIDQVDRYENLFVTRTLSKAFAFAAGRCGFLIGNEETMEKIRPQKVPYNVNSMTQCAATIILSHKEELLTQCDLIKQEREHMIKECKDFNDSLLTLYPSHANFIYGRSAKKEELLKKFEEAGITIRNYHDNSFRITIGTPQENEKVYHILRSFKEEFQ